MSNLCPCAVSRHCSVFFLSLISWSFQDVSRHKQTTVSEFVKLQVPCGVSSVRTYPLWYCLSFIIIRCLRCLDFFCCIHLNNAFPLEWAVLGVIRLTLNMLVVVMIVFIHSYSAAFAWMCLCAFFCVLVYSGIFQGLQDNKEIKELELVISGNEVSISCDWGIPAVGYAAYPCCFMWCSHAVWRQWPRSSLDGELCSFEENLNPWHQQ